MRRINSRYHNKIRLCPGKHLIEIGERWAICSDQLATGFDTFDVLVAQPDKLDLARIFSDEILSPHSSSPVAGAHYRVSAPNVASGRDRHRTSQQGPGRADACSFYEFASINFTAHNFSTL